MSRRRLGIAAAVAVVAAVVAVAALAGPRLLAPAADASEAALPAQQAVAARTTLTPSVHLFGDPVEARLRVAVDGRRIDPASVLVEWDFAPYEPVGEPRVERREAGELTLLSYVVTLRCLDVGCVPPQLPSAAGEMEGGRGERHTFQLEPVRVTFDGDVDSRTVRWPPLEVVSRINVAEYAATAEGQWTAVGPGSPFAHGLAPAAPTYSLPPRLVAALALAGAALLLLVPVAAVAAALRRRRRTPAERWALLQPRERARRLALWAAANDDAAERRRVLELAAAQLGAEGEQELAEQARQLAWSGGAPAPDDAAGLAESLNGGGRRAR